jgi:hypothetical protein
MSKTHILNRPTKVSDLSLDDFYDEISTKWQQRAQSMQVRRLRAMKREMKGRA